MGSIQTQFNIVIVIDKAQILHKLDNRRPAFDVGQYTTSKDIIPIG